MSISKIKPIFYRVEKNENLKSIAEKFNVNPTQILINNSISPRQIEEGFIIYLNL